MTGFEMEFPLMPTDEELRQMHKEIMKEKLQVIDGGKDKIEDQEE